MPLDRNYGVHDEYGPVAIRLYRSGVSASEIAKMLDVHVGTIHKWIREYKDL